MTQNRIQRVDIVETPIFDFLLVHERSGSHDAPDKPGLKALILPGRKRVGELRTGFLDEAVSAHFQDIAASHPDYVVGGFTSPNFYRFHGAGTDNEPVKIEGGTLDSFLDEERIRRLYDIDVENIRKLREAYPLFGRDYASRLTLSALRTCLFNGVWMEVVKQQGTHGLPLSRERREANRAIIRGDTLRLAHDDTMANNGHGSYSLWEYSILSAETREPGAEAKNPIYPVTTLQLQRTGGIVHGQGGYEFEDRFHR